MDFAIIFFDVLLIQVLKDLWLVIIRLANVFSCRYEQPITVFVNCVGKQSGFTQNLTGKIPGQSKHCV
jgi:hypothetical protein